MNRQLLNRHLLGWLAYAGYQVLGKFQSNSATPLSNQLWLTLSFVLVNMVTFYVCYLVVYPRYLRAGRTGTLLAALGGAFLLFVGLRALLEELLYPALLGFHNYNLDGLTGYNIGFYIGDNLYFALPALVVSAALWAARAALQREQENHQLRSEKQAAEAAFLKTQINPHFLYNTLNMLYGLAYPLAKPVASAILKLSDLMRYMLCDTPDGRVLLSEEIDYLHNYLDLYRLRFADQFHVQFHLDGNPAGHRVAPLLLIPFVENALKHGLLDDPDHPVQVYLRVGPGTLQFEVHNRPLNPTDHRDATTGVGLPNLRRRLALEYAGRHTLHVRAEPEQFVTSLQLTGV